MINLRLNSSLETDTTKVTLGSVVDEQDQLKEMTRNLEITLESAKKDPGRGVFFLALC